MAFTMGNGWYYVLIGLLPYQQVISSFSNMRGAGRCLRSAGRCLLSVGRCLRGAGCGVRGVESEV